GAGRADAAAAWRQGVADPAGAQADDTADHAQSHRSRAALRSSPGHDVPAGPAEAGRRHKSAASTRLRSRQQRRLRTLRRRDLAGPARGSESRHSRRRIARAPGGSETVTLNAWARSRGGARVLGAVT